MHRPVAIPFTISNHNHWEWPSRSGRTRRRLNGSDSSITVMIFLLLE